LSNSVLGSDCRWIKRFGRLILRGSTARCRRCGKLLMSRFVASVAKEVSLDVAEAFLFVFVLSERGVWSEACCLG
jgi:uncharacterized paraquat-inducible protein A